ncbi:hypothetical protein KJ966_02095 [bacterium]|nr:hypothetical protein [bacterium]
MKIPSGFLLLITILLLFQGSPTCLLGQVKNHSDSTLKETREFLSSVGKRYSSIELEYLKRLNLSNLRITDENIEKLNGLEQLQTLILSGTQISGSGLGSLSKNRQLKTLILKNTLLQNDQLVSISGIRQLSQLNISETELNDQGLLSLEKLSNLRHLNVSSTRISNEGMEIIGNLSSLESLNLGHNQLSDTGIKSLGRLQNLETLVLRDTLISDDGLVHLMAMSSLKNLDLSDTRITNQGLEHLKKISKLSSLNLANTDIDANGLSDIFEFIGLTYVSVSGTHISYADFMNLKRSMPHVEMNAHYVVIPPDSKIDVKRIFGDGDSEKESKPSPAVDIWIKKPLVVGLAVPFEIAFINSDGFVDSDYRLETDLVFKLKNVPFTLFSGGIKKSGQDSITLSKSEVYISKGIIKGEIAVERVSSRRKLEIYQTSLKKDVQPEYIGSSRIDRLFSDVERVVFSENYLEGNTGEELEIRISAYNYLGQKIKGKIGKTIGFLILSNHDLIIDGKMQRYAFEIHPSRFRNGEASIKVKAEKKGQYVLSFDSGQRPYDNNLPSRGNYVSIKIESSI